MRYLAAIVICALVLVACSAKETSAPTLYTELDSLIRGNDNENIERVCSIIGNTDLQLRDHCVAVRLLHMVLDSVNIDVLASFCGSAMGWYIPYIDSVSPIRYFCNENIEKRLGLYQKKHIKNEKITYDDLFLLGTVLSYFDPYEFDQALSGKDKNPIINIEETDNEGTDSIVTDSIGTDSIGY